MRGKRTARPVGAYRDWMCELRARCTNVLAILDGITLRYIAQTGARRAMDFEEVIGMLLISSVASGVVLLVMYSGFVL